MDLGEINIGYYSNKRIAIVFGDGEYKITATVNLVDIHLDPNEVFLNNNHIYYNEIKKYFDDNGFIEKELGLFQSGHCKYLKIKLSEKFFNSVKQ